MPKYSCNDCGRQVIVEGNKKVIIQTVNDDVFCPHDQCAAQKPANTTVFNAGMTKTED